MKEENNWMVTVVSVMVISQGDSSKNTDSYLVNCWVHLTYECENHSADKFLITQGQRSPD